MTVLGVDLGEKRIGLAISDPEERIALPAGAIQAKGREKDLAALCALARERDVGSVVVGLPIHMSGREGPEAKRARSFAEALAQRSGLPVSTLDERWTSIAAERALAEEATSARRRKRQRKEGTVDALAATLLLRTWLEREQPEGSENPS